MRAAFPVDGGPTHWPAARGAASGGAGFREVHQHGTDRLTDTVTEVLATQPPPLEALRSWFTTLTGYVRIKPGLGEALHSAAAKEVGSASCPPVTAVQRLLDACVESGTAHGGGRGKGDAVVPGGGCRAEKAPLMPSRSGRVPVHGFVVPARLGGDGTEFAHPARIAVPDAGRRTFRPRPGDERKP
ncbi:hypothetical protein ABTY96_08675 [Streptomyces sp. NPDC096057]|uniref:hypothetical protein n=1 Tax=Streptomyces sp. NPDC096057 TaxID=3155543 RepID=UPI00332253FD